MRMSTRLALVAGVFAIVLVPPSRADVYRCVSAGGRISYQQTRCDAQSEPMELMDQSSGGSELRPGEQELLRRYEERDARSRRRTVDRPEVSAAPDRTCWRKRSQLEAVRLKLRHGYSARESDELRRKRKNYEDYLEQFCSSD